MPYKCCVATCRGNYQNGPKVAVFSFPQDPELKAKWIWSLKRSDDFQPTKYSRVCELHFRPHEVLRETEMFDEKNGKLVKAPLAYPRLKSNSIPSQFHDGPPHLTSTTSAVTSRESPDKKRRRREMEALDRAIQESINTKEAYDAAHSFNTLEELTTCLENETLPDSWKIIHTDDRIMFLYIQCTPAPEVVASAVIDTNLKVSTFLNRTPISLDKMPLQVNSTNDILKLLDSLTSQSVENERVQQLLCSLNDLLNQLKSLIPEKECEISFLTKQLMMLNVAKQSYRYSTDLMIFCSLLYTISPHSYKFLCKSGYLTIPNPRTIKRLCARFSVNPITEQLNGDFLGYIRKHFRYLEEKDKIVVLMMDEIHLKPGMDFKGGNVCGMAHDSDAAATSAHVFMIRSFLSQYEDVAHILPVKKITADGLYQYLRKVIIGLEEIGYKVIAVVSDNNAINKKALSIFATPSKVSIIYNHPADPSRPLFYLFDSVHILKCIRNNWINQKNDQCMNYPNWEKFFSVQIASFACLKRLHSIESGNLLKYGYGLTLKALYPTNLERQNVKLALQVFDDRVAEGLMYIGKENTLPNYKDTADFIKIIATWWSIVNVKTIFKGHHKLDKYQEPLTSDSDHKNLQYLQKMIEWLDAWERMGLKAGTLTKETHLALSHTTRGLIALAKYCTEELKFRYLLPGKVQTDTLENRFGAYRQFSGSMHNVSIRQVYETENKLRLQGILPTIMESSKYGQISINFDVDENSVEEVCKTIDREICLFADRIVVVDDDILHAQKDIQLLTYIAGYCCYSVTKRLNCQACKLSITLNKQLVVEIDKTCHKWTKIFDRGGLLYPHPDVLNCIVCNYIVITKLISKEFETEFLSVSNQRNVTIAVTENILDQNSIYLDLSNCENGHEPSKVLHQIVRASTNILLNNYCKVKNDQHLSSKNLSKQRKLKTLTH